MKSPFSIVFIYLLTIPNLINAQSRETKDYIIFLNQNFPSIELKEANQIIVFHFDYCAISSYCADTSKTKKMIDRLEATDLLIIDTLYSDYLPPYIDRKRVYFVNRDVLKRKGYFYNSPVLIRKKKKKIKLLY